MQDSDPAETLLNVNLSHLPKPDPMEMLPLAGSSRFREGALTHLVTHYEEYGIGSIFAGRAMLLSPNALDGVFVGLGLAKENDPAIALTATSLGAVKAVTLSGRLILVDPLSGTVHVVFGQAASEDTIAFQSVIAEEIAAVGLQLEFDDPEIDLDGNPLHQVLARALGPLAVNSCYGATLSIQDENAFDSKTWRIWNLEEYILDRHEDEAFEFTEFRPT